MINDIQRVFTFGCSFTSYSWPTWADMLVQDFKNKGLTGKNFGRCGAGNYYMFIKFMEADQLYKFTDKDLILFCWTSFQREDRRYEGKWFTPGNIYTAKIYTDDFKLNWVDPEHYAVRDCAIISNIKQMLTLRGIPHITFSMNNLEYIDSSNNDLVFQSVNKVIEFYGETVKTDLPPMMEYLGLNNREHKNKIKRPKSVWDDNPRHWIYEWHPTPEEHHIYLKDNILPKINYTLEEKTLNFIDEWVKQINLEASPIYLGNTGWDQINDCEIIK